LSLGDFTAGEQAWLAMQTRIDEGLKYCEACDIFGWHTFCGSCSRRFIGADKHWRKCPECHHFVPSDFCPLCGASVADDFLRAMEAGTVDMEAESAHAARVMDQFYGARPELAPASHQPKDTLGRAMMEVFGRNG
jgi:hypothetical protein